MPSKLDAIKIDKNFVSGLCQDPQVMAVAHATVQVIENLGMVSIAEGVEDPADVAALQAMGCRCGQGHLFARPVPADELPRVKVSIKVRARSGERKLEVAVTWPQDQVAPPEIPNKIDAVVRGSLPDLRALDGAAAPPVVAVARRDKPTAEFPDGSIAFGLEFTDAVPVEVKERLTLDAPLTRIALAPAPAQPAR